MSEHVENIDHIYESHHFFFDGHIEIKARPYYVPERSIPEKNFYFYAYHIEIKNNSNQTCKLLRRQWNIRNGNGHAKEVEGVGVIGKTPIFEPGEEFEYTSFCHIKTPTGNMRGRYLFSTYEIDPLTDKEILNEKFWVEVPLFFLRTPETFLH
ncbi:MAG: Co2+/Mg2+ efflux protein ApaG [Bacteriovoracaceae bacterium]